MCGARLVLRRTSLFVWLYVFIVFAIRTRIEYHRIVVVFVIVIAAIVVVVVVVLFSSIIVLHHLVQRSKRSSLQQCRDVGLQSKLEYIFWRCLSSRTVRAV